MHIILDGWLFLRWRFYCVKDSRNSICKAWEGAFPFSDSVVWDYYCSASRSKLGHNFNSFVEVVRESVGEWISTHHVALLWLHCLMTYSQLTRSALRVPVTLPNMKVAAFQSTSSSGIHRAWMDDWLLASVKLWVQSTVHTFSHATNQLTNQLAN